MTHLRIHISLVARFEGAEETVVASRFFRGALTQLRIRILRLPGIEVADKTGKLSRYVSAVLVFAVARPVGSGKTVANGTDESVFSEAFF